MARFALSIIGISISEQKNCPAKSKELKRRLTGSNGSVVLRGLQAVLNERALSHKWSWAMNMRQRLKEDGVLEVNGDTLVFSRNA